MTKRCLDTLFRLLDCRICKTDNLQSWERSVAIAFADDFISIESLSCISFDEGGHERGKVR